MARRQGSLFDGVVFPGFSFEGKSQRDRTLVPIFSEKGVLQPW